MTACSIAAISLAVLAQGPNNRPPKLTFDKPVDYVTWLIDTTKPGKVGNALDDYEKLDSVDAQGMPRVGPTVLSHPKEDVVKLFKPYGVKWSPVNRPALAEFLRKHERAIDEFEKATARDRLWLKLDSRVNTIGDMRLSSLSTLRDGSSLLLARSCLKPDCSGQRIRSAVQCVLRASRHSQQMQFAIGSLVAYSLQNNAFEALRSAIDQKLISDAECLAVFAEVKNSDPCLPDLADVMRQEWASSLDLLQSVFPNGRSTRENWLRFFKKMKVDMEEDESWSGADEGGFLSHALKIEPQKNADSLDQYFEKITQICLTSPQQSNVQAFEQAEELLPNDAPNLTIPFFRTSQKRWYELTIRAESLRRGTMIVLAIHAHHARHQAWPTTLAKIDPELGLGNLDATRIDPYSGDDFKYKLVDAKPLLYSIGADSRDDQGRHDPKWGESSGGGDYVFWPYQSEKIQD